MNLFISLSRGIDAINTWIGRASGWLLLVAVLISGVNAVVRKVFSVSSNAWLDAQWYLFGAVFMLCASYTLIKDGHVRIDLVASKLSPRARSVIELLGHLLFLLPFTLLMVYESWPFALESMLAGEDSSNAGGLLVWPAKMIILVGFLMLFLQGVSELIKRVAIMKGILPEPQQSVEVALPAGPVPGTGLDMDPGPASGSQAGISGLETR